MISLPRRDHWQKKKKTNKHQRENNKQKFKFIYIKKRGNLYNYYFGGFLLNRLAILTAAGKYPKVIWYLAIIGTFSNSKPNTYLKRLTLFSYSISSLVMPVSS